MYYNKEDITATKTQSKSDFATGTVNIYNKNVTLRHNSYDKREKLFNEEGKWINTKPLTLNDLETILDENN